MKKFLISALGLLALLSITACKPVTEQQAKEEATARFFKVCANFHYLPSWFDGPTKTDVGGAAFAYKWASKNQSDREFGILITVDEGGGTNVSLSGQIPDTPDPTKLPP